MSNYRCGIMANALGEEIKRIYFYEENLFDKRGELIIYEGGYAIKGENQTLEIPKEMIVEIIKGKETPFAKQVVLLKYLDYTGVERDMNLIISREDVSILFNKR